MKVIVAGSRTIRDFVVVRNAILGSGFDVTEIVSGGVPGVDQLGERWARLSNVPIRRFEPKWTKLGRPAGAFRNREMAEYADTLVLVWDGKSRGSANMLKCMKRLNKPVHLVVIKP